MFKSQVSSSTAHTDTTEKLIDTLTVPDGVTKIVGVQCHALGGAGITTLENTTGKFRLRNKSRGDEYEFLIRGLAVLTSGVGIIDPPVDPCDIPVSPTNQLEGYVTMDLAQTVGNTCRFRLIYA